MPINNKLQPKAEEHEETLPGSAPKVVISASRRSDLVAHFPEWLAKVLAAEKVSLFSRYRRPREVCLQPEGVHTLVLWSKDFTHLLQNKAGLRDLTQKYSQVFFHLTITGLGGTPAERHVLPPHRALEQLKPLLALAGSAERLSLRFDPVVYWWEGKTLRSNLDFFPILARQAAACGLRRVIFSLAQWYPKAKRRAERAGFPFFDPPEEEKLAAAEKLSQVAASLGLEVYACAQTFLTKVPGVKPSACIDGRFLQTIHPTQAAVSWKKDRSQRLECNCTESIDIGSYSQSCPHSCLYCYANSRV